MSSELNSFQSQNLEASQNATYPSCNYYDNKEGYNANSNLSDEYGKKVLSVAGDGIGAYLCGCCFYCIVIIGVIMLIMGKSTKGIIIIGSIVLIAFIYYLYELKKDTNDLIDTNTKIKSASGARPCVGNVDGNQTLPKKVFK